MSNLEFFHRFYILDKEITGLLKRNFGVKDEEYPEWLLDYYKNEVLKTLASILSNITHANTICASSEQEFYFRRQYQWNAIGDCEYLLQIMQRAMTNLPVDVNKYVRYVDMITHETQLLRDWKKSDNKILKVIQGRNSV